MNVKVLIIAIVAAAAVRADPTVETAASAAPAPASKIGISLGLGGGVTNFASSDMTGVADVGGAWEVRATIGTRGYLAAEAAYVGTRRNVNLAGVAGNPGESPHIFSHGLEGAVRVQYPYLTGNWLIEPFASGGLGFSHLGVDAIVSQAAAMKTSDDVFVVPVGAGVSATWNRFVFEGRFTYRATFDQDLLTKANGETANLSNWSAGALVGYEF